MQVQCLMPFIENLRFWMDKRGLRAVDLAEKTGWPASRISQLFIEYRRPGLKTITKLAEALECSVDDLIAGNPISRGIPVIAEVSAGYGVASDACDQYAVGDGFDYIELPPGVSQEKADHEGIYALKVKGDSMKPRLYDGNILYIRPGRNRDFKNGDLVIFRDSEGTGWVKEIETVNHDTIIFKSIGYGPTIIKKLSEIDVLERVYLIMP